MSQDSEKRRALTRAELEERGDVSLSMRAAGAAASRRHGRASQPASSGPGR
jgi:hypothetical protein